VTRDEIGNYGAWAAIFGGGLIYLVLLGLDFVGGWSLPYPYSLIWLLAGALPASGVAVLFLRAQADLDGMDQGPPEGEE
jgi:hypothetical protein